MEFSPVPVFMLADGVRDVSGGAVALVGGFIAVLKLLISKIGVDCL